MNGLREKFRNKKGFTLIEMLIVVAIIAILVAVSIPLVNGALERSREATDAANERSFKAVLTISYLNGKYEQSNGGATKFEVGKVYVYDAANGTLVTSMNNDLGYGKSTSVMGADNVDRQKWFLAGYIDTNGVAHMQWVETAASGGGGTTAITGSNLISSKMASNI